MVVEEEEDRVLLQRQGEEAEAVAVVDPVLLQRQGEEAEAEAEAEVEAEERMVFAVFRRCLPHVMLFDPAMVPVRADPIRMRPRREKRATEFRSSVSVVLFHIHARIRRESAWDSLNLMYVTHVCVR